MTDKTTLADVYAAENAALAAEKDARRWEKLALKGEQYISHKGRVSVAGACAAIAQVCFRADKIRVDATTETLENMR